jgi:hypothetical protein
VGGDLFGPPLSSDVLGVRQLGTPGGASKGNEIVGDHRYSSSRTLLPWRVRGRIDDDLADDPPASVMRITTRDQKTRERVGDPLGLGVGRVDIEMPQRCADVATAIHCPCQISCGPPRSVSRVVDQPTLPAAKLRISMVPHLIGPLYPGARA